MSDPWLVFDVETTGVDALNDRIVQVFIGIYDDKGGPPLGEYEWFINPGVEVPEEAAEVHGFTTEWLQENGQAPEKAFTEIRNLFLSAVDLPWVAFNLNFDLTFIDAEFKGHSISDKFGDYAKNNVQLIDGLVIDRAKDKYRKGKRKLEFMAAHYGVEFDPEKAHDASYDVDRTHEVTRAIVKKFGIPTNREQAAWYKTWALGLEEYLRRTDPTATVDSEWPLRTV